MKQSETIKGLLESLVKAQSEFTTLPKDKDGYGYKYTDLDTVISAIRPVLFNNNLGFTQSLTTTENGERGITTRVFNTAGEWLEDTIALPEISMAKTNAAQNLGAAITYMKRYALCAVLGISSDEDTDAATKENPKFEAKPKKALKGGDATPEERDALKRLFESKYEDGINVFNKDDITKYSSMRTEKTSSEVIAEIKKELVTRLNAKDGPSPAMSAEEEKQSKMIF